MDENKTPDPPLISVNKLTDVAQSAADALLEVLKLVPPIPVGSKLHKALEEIRSVQSSAKHFADADVQVDVKPEQAENQMISKEANEWLEIAITALSVNDQRKAEQYLLKFNNVCPSDSVKMILDIIQLKISQMPKAKENDQNPNILMVDRFIDIAYKAIAGKDMTKALHFLNSAEMVMTTQKAKKLLQHLKRGIPKLETDTAEKFIECAMTAMADDQYDVAELLLKTASIQYHSESAKRTRYSSYLGGVKPMSKQISQQTDLQRKLATEKFVKLAEKLISEGHNKVAESVLIIAHYTDGGNPHVWVLLDNINKLLYPSKVDFNVESSLCQWFNGIIPSYDSQYFITMACRAFEYADDAQLALEFFNEADRMYLYNANIKSYIEKLRNSKLSIQLDFL